MKQEGTHLKNPSGVSGKVQRFISRYLRSSGASGLVIGLSGGLDSATALHLCANAVGPKKVFALVLPTTSTPSDDISDAVRHASNLGVEYRVIQIDALLKTCTVLLPEGDDRVRGNLIARMRMSILYYFAALRGSLVVGTSDKSEVLIGYFTKFGDGGSDLAPIASLYKTQVRELAKYIGVPRKIIEKKSSPRLWPEQLAEEELGLSYDAIDPILHYLVDGKMKPKQIARKLSIPLGDVRKVESMVKASAHKRNMPPAAQIP